MSLVVVCWNGSRFVQVTVSPTRTDRLGGWNAKFAMAMLPGGTAVGVRLAVGVGLAVTVGRRVAVKVAVGVGVDVPTATPVPVTVTVIVTDGLAPAGVVAVTVVEGPLRDPKPSIASTWNE